MNSQSGPDWNVEDSLALDQALTEKEKGKVDLIPLDPSTIRVRPRDWLVPNLLLKRQVTMMVAPGGTGKSSVALAIACGVASGADLLGYQTCERTNALVLNSEDDKAEIERRFKAISDHYGLNFGETQVHVPSGSVDLFTDGNELQLSPQAHNLIDHINERKIGLVVIDPFVSVHSVDENNNQAINRVVQRLRYIARLTNAAILIVHHTRKAVRGESNAGNVDASRGAIALVDGVRAAITLTTMTDGQAKHRGIQKDESQRYVQISDGKQNYGEKDRTEKWIKLISVVDEAGESVGVATLADVAKPENWGISATTVAATLCRFLSPGVHRVPEIKGEYAANQGIQISTANSHFVLLPDEDNATEISIDDQAFKVWKSKSGTKRNSPSSVHIEVIG